MKKSQLLIVSLLLLAWACSGASADIFTSDLTSTTTTQILVLNCSFCPKTPGPNEFDYALTNPLLNTDHIRGLTLQFPGIPTTDIVGLTTPPGWTFGKVDAENKVFWTWTNFADPTQQLDPGETFQFSFTSNLGFGSGTSGSASAQNGNGFSGFTCGPTNVVPEPMSMLLGAMGLCSVLGFRKLRR